MSISLSHLNWPSDRDFAILLPSLILLPTPSAAHVKPYRTLFRKLHADASFCSVAFGEDFEPIIWDDDEMKTFLLEHDTAKSWKRSGMGDFAVGVLNDREWFDKVEGKMVKSSKEEAKIVEGKSFEELRRDFESEGVKWVGYTCVRNAVTTGGSITRYYSSAPTDNTLPSQEEMTEVRYGMDPGFRGRGLATKAAETVMAWAAETQGVRRFIAETEKRNGKSQGLLKKLGFVETEEFLGFKDEDDDGNVVEWVKVVG